MKKTTKIVLFILLICALVCAGVLVGLNYGRWFGDKPVTPTAAPTEARSLLELDPDAGEYVTPSPAPKADGIAIPGWGSIMIPAGKTEVAVHFPNPEANEGKYYLTFELRLKETGEVLYKSGLVKPGLHIQRVTLTRALEAGEYPAIVHVQPYKMDEAQTPTNNANMETVLIVVEP